MNRSAIGALVVAGLCMGSISTAAPATATRHHIKQVNTISYAPNDYVIGNAYQGWTDDLTDVSQFGRGPGNPRGATYGWGFLHGENFDRCAWVNTYYVGPEIEAHPDLCREAQQVDLPFFKATFTDGRINPNFDTPTHMDYSREGCVDPFGYGNVEPWRNPATPHNQIRPQLPNGKTLLWRYITRDSKWALVLDPHPQAKQTNWYFVQRACIKLNDGE